MSMNGYLEEDELILYAMQALSEPETAAVEEQLARDTAMRDRLAEIRLTLGVYATATVPLEEVPAGSKERFLQLLQQSAIPVQSNVVQMPVRDAQMQPGERKRSAAMRVLPWVGWAIAAMLLVGLALQHKRTQCRGPAR